MTTVPLVFAFDNNLAMPAAVCFYSLLVNAGADTTYEINVLHSERETIDKRYIDRVLAEFPRHRINYITVDNTFDNAFEIRGITTPAYYRLLIPILLPQYDKVIYSDVDVIFRDDLSSVYSIDMADMYIGGVRAMAHLDDDLNKYYVGLGLDPKDIIYSGNLLINSKLLRDDSHVLDEFKELGRRNFKFQDMDIINMACRGRIKFLPFTFCLTSYFYKFAIYDRTYLQQAISDEEIDRTLTKGLIHYNGRKPWQGYCPNFDIWWEYYRKSPVFDQKFYFDFFYDKLDELDRLPLMKRIKILARYFVYGKK